MIAVVGRKLDGWLSSRDGFAPRPSLNAGVGGLRESFDAVCPVDGYICVILGSMIIAKPSSMAVAV